MPLGEIKFQLESETKNNWKYKEIGGFNVLYVSKSLVSSPAPVITATLQG